MEALSEFVIQHKGEWGGQLGNADDYNKSWYPRPHKDDHPEFMMLTMELDDHLDTAMAARRYGTISYACFTMVGGDHLFYGCFGCNKRTQCMTGMFISTYE